MLIGLVLFFVLAKLVLWRHCHERNCEVHGQAAPLILGILTIALLPATHGF